MTPLPKTLMMLQCWRIARLSEWALRKRVVRGSPSLSISLLLVCGLSRDTLDA